MGLKSSFIHSFIHSPIRHLLNACQEPGPVLDAVDTSMKKHTLLLEHSSCVGQTDKQAVIIHSVNERWWEAQANVGVQKRRVYPRLVEVIGNNCWRRWQSFTHFAPQPLQYITKFLHLQKWAHYIPRSYIFGVDVYFSSWPLFDFMLATWVDLQYWRAFHIPFLPSLENYPLISDSLWET